MVVIGADPALGTTGTIDGLTLLPSADVFARAEVISLHLPKPAGAPPIIGAAEIAKMKHGVLLVNCARGGVVDEDALQQGLQSGRIGGAALDVFEIEPPKNAELYGHPRVIATPHIGASTVEAQARVGLEVAEILLAEI